MAGTLVAALVAVIGMTLAPTHDEAQARVRPSVLRVHYEAGWELYDNGFWELYDNGFAGGPNTLR